jgi:hypothetical protein
LKTIWSVINTLKVERVQNTFENLNSSEMMCENAKNDANISKMHFWGFSLFFCYFLFFLKIYKKTWVKNWVATCVMQD